MAKRDYYDVLGIARAASDQEIKAAFRRLAKECHPDRCNGDQTSETRFKEVNEAYEVLGDPEKRKKYDELGANWRMYEHAGAHPGAGPFPGGFNVGGTGGRGGFRTMTQEEMEDLFGDSNPFSDFFTTFFGGGMGGDVRGSAGGRGGGVRQRPGRDIENEIELSLEDAYNGTTQRLALTHDGHRRTVDVRFPAGVVTGSRVRLSGEGEQGVGGGQAGHLYLRVRLKPHPTFELKDRDLHVRVPVPVTTAVLGGEADVQTLSGKPARLRIPPLTQNGQVFRLKGYGMPAVGKPDEKGDLYARVDVQLPAQLTTEEREHYEALRRSSGGSATKNSAA
jgi:curved DNA-binding protein